MPTTARKRTRKPLLVVLLAPIAVIALTAGSCDTNDGGGTKTQAAGQKLTSNAFARQSAAVPYPASQLTDSLERRNLREKLLRENKADKIGYVYIYNFGNVVGFYAIKGKVSSNQSAMTPDQFELTHGSYGQSVVNAPGDDGSYGDNEPGVFFFTTEGNMVKTSLDYIYSEQPLSIDTPRLNKPGTAGPAAQ